VFLGACGSSIRGWHVGWESGGAHGTVSAREESRCPAKERPFKGVSLQQAANDAKEMCPCPFVLSSRRRSVDPMIPLLRTGRFTNVARCLRTGTVIGLVALLALSCGRQGAVCDGRTFARIFRDFIFVGSFSDEPRGYGIPAHGYDPVPIPEAFVSGRRYVFVHVGPLDAAQFAIKELPGRMKAAGLQVLHAPRALDEMPTAEPTGFVWWIDFRAGQCAGRICPSLDPVLYQRGGLAPNGSMEVFVITIGAK
jgi:hypothetical protein